MSQCASLIHSIIVNGQEIQKNLSDSIADEIIANNLLYYETL
jgi:hypothetical protein